MKQKNDEEERFTNLVFTFLHTFFYKLKVTRLNTYSTVPAIWTDEQQTLAKSVDIVTFASPSAVKIWSEKVGNQFTAVVIGPSSAKAATTCGFQKVISPEGSKGIGAWAESIKSAVSILESGSVAVPVIEEK